jgi:hypothetical protein
MRVYQGSRRVVAGTNPAAEDRAVLGVAALPSDALSLADEKSVMVLTELPPEKQKIAEALWTLEMPAPGGLQWAAFIGTNGALAVIVCADAKALNIAMAQHRIAVDLSDCETSEQVLQAVSAKLVEHWQEARRQDAANLDADEQVIAALVKPSAEDITGWLACNRTVRAEVIAGMAAVLNRMCSAIGLTCRSETDGPIQFVRIDGSKPWVEKVVALFASLRNVPH